MTLNRGIYSIKPEEYRTYMQSSHKEEMLENLDAIIRMLICILIIVVLFFLYKGVEKSKRNIISAKSVAPISHHIKIEEKIIGTTDQSLNKMTQTDTLSTLPIQEPIKKKNEGSIKEIIEKKPKINSETTISEEYLRLITEELNH